MMNNLKSPSPYHSNSAHEFARQLRAGTVGVLPTDTLYALVASALREDAVERVYEIKKRNRDKPLIVLLSALSDLGQFDITPDKKLSEILARVWPGPVSVILDCSGTRFAYLHRGTQSIAFRVPNNKGLQNFLKESGPLVAPSANPEGKPPAYNVEEARAYFGDSVDPVVDPPRQIHYGVDFYLDGGELRGEPSKLVRFQNGKIEVLRAGV